MIRYQEFIKLPLEERIKTLFMQGNFVIDIRYYGYKVNLYLLFDFYVEVFYNHKLDKIEKIELMDYSSSRIKFYADQISIPLEYSTKGE